MARCVSWIYQLVPSPEDCRSGVCERPNRLTRIILALLLTAVPVISSGVAAEASTSIVSVADGAWSSGSTWSSGRPPGIGDDVTVSTGHTVTIDVESARVSGVVVEGTGSLVFDAARRVILESSGNVVVHGRLVMVPSSPTIVHTLRFVDVDEAEFVGGGMDVLASDVGLWVRHRGKLDLQGTAKTAWTRLADSAPAGATQLELAAAPTGWRSGDQLVVTPTEPPSVGSTSYSGFDEVQIVSVSGTTVTLDRPLEHAHPEVAGRWTAEVLNLSRNVRVEGTGDGTKYPGTNGRAHVNIHSQLTQNVRYVQLSHLGPRSDTGKTTSEGMKTEGVLGRYPLHFHHNGDASRGTVVEGVVVAHAGNHAFVPHASHGITIRDSIAYDVWDEAYWWDPPPWEDPKSTANDTHGNVWERDVAAVVKTDPSFRGYRLTGFNLGRGDNGTNVIRGSVAVGVQGSSDANGFNWPERAGAVWIFEDNVAHNNKVDGAFVWQNSTNVHVIERFDAYHNGEYGLDHGAYNNQYQYVDVTLLGNGSGAVSQRALSKPEPDARADGYGLAFESVVTDGKLSLSHHNLPSGIPTLYHSCSFSHVVVNETAEPGLHDFVNCGLEPQDFELKSQPSGSRIRVQRANGTAFQIDDQGRVTTIAPFYDAPAEGEIDSTPPEVTLDSPHDGADLSGSVVLTATATDASGIDRVVFVVDGTVVGSDRSVPFSVNWDSTAVGDGSHRLRAKAYDTSGNRAASTSVVVTVSNVLEAPATSIISGPSGTVASQSATFEFTASEADASFQCRLDGSRWRLCVSPRSYRGLRQGKHVFEVRAMDSVGNTDPTPATRSWTVDTPAPKTPITGDWDGDGDTELGWYSDGDVALRMDDGSVTRFRFGRPGDHPVTGDWDGDGVDTIGVVRGIRWYLRNSHSGGAGDRHFDYGRIGDIPLPGNWDGERGDEAGVIRDGTWYLNDELAGGIATWSFRYGRVTRGD
ncbi:MAG: Ig-like domain-containing protein, partial [Nitriliruptorales bacterium]|nr:Ig-like domain-containing protein [Nitriliruptorales bacterium]